MKTRIRFALGAALAAALCTLAMALGPEAPAAPAAPTTEDILLMNDGRELHGQIVTENDKEIIFEYSDRVLGMKTQIRISPRDVATIKRDVPLEAKTPSQPARKAVRPAAGDKPAEEAAPRFGKSRLGSSELMVPSFYLIPMRGQMGTDINKGIYEKVVKDIADKKPDVLVFVLDSAEYPDLMIPEANEDPTKSPGLLLIEEYQELVSMLHDDLSKYRQVMWVKDSVGLSSLLALAWPEVYMTPSARLWGLRNVIDRTGADKWSDTDIRAKMSAAWSGFAKSFLEYGGHSMELADAMLWPDKKLSATFKGRKVIWALDDTGELVVDNDTKKTVGLRAKEAEDLLISTGTVETVDDLAFLMGYREYRQVEGGGEKLVEDYIRDWRRLYDQTKVWWGDYFQHKDWAKGDDALKFLGRSKSDLEQIINAMGRYKAVELSWQTEMGVSKVSLEVQVEKLKEQIRGLKGNRGGGYGGGAGGGGMGSGG